MMYPPLSVVIVLPVMNREWAAESSSLLLVAPNWRGSVLEVPNWDQNIGVPASWNRGIDMLEDQHAEYLIILSEALLPTGFGQFCQDLALSTMQGFAGLEGPHWWHLAGIHRSTIDRVGRFDEGFVPGYYEDADYHYRMKLAGLEMKYIDQPYGTDRGTAHCLTQGLVTMDYGAVTARYVRKWGGLPLEETFTEPFDGQPE